jgi:uncharacterized circularly permuted ATP-grasp superfamily protein/uncharacterized alpha-E superfamily protein
MINSYLDEKRFNNTPFLDEMSSPDFRINPHWLKLANYYENMGADKMEQFHEDVSKQLRENGVTYNVYGDPDGLNRPWNLDPVPMIFGSEDWSITEKGLVQRANLLNFILDDLYGSRTLIKDGLIPFELIYNHGGFLRQLDKIKLQGEQQLIQYSADLARGPDGKMWVLHDRTDAPSGAGYTFENRAAMTRVFPDLVRENQVSKISSYYQTFRNTLSHLSVNNKENPRVVLLSPGATNETYFEHAYISSFMGFTLAFGDDLTVSNGYVWLKTIKGLEKVDVIIRRVDDVFCDPLEFRSDSQLGVVGLMEAVRQKKVLVVNPLGCRILENPALMAFLPKLSRHILKEELILPSVATWWCGQQKELNYVIANIKTLIIRQIYRGESNKSVYGGELSKLELDDLVNKIKKYPYLYTAQEMVDFSTTPSWIDSKLEARNSVFRSYVVADTEQKEYKVMPGGLSRSSPKKGVFIVSNQSGGISKDTWVLGNKQDAIKHVSNKDLTVQRSVKIALPSRTGEHLFWLGRYMERSTFTVRLLRIVLLTYNESDKNIHEQEDEVLSTLLKSLTALTGTLPGFTEDKLLKKPETELLALALDLTKTGSLAHSIQSMLSNSYAVRDRLSLDTWRILDSISEETLNMRKYASNLTQIYRGLDSLIVKLMAFYGLNIDNMTREVTWHLLNTGRFIESAINNCTIILSLLTKKLDTESDKSLMEDVLRCNESLVTYRYHYRSNLEISGVLSLLILNEENPRSVLYQILKIQYHSDGLPQAENEEGLSEIQKKLLEATTKIRLCDLEKMVATVGDENEYDQLIVFLTEIISLLKDSSYLIFEQYFSHTQNRYSMIQTDLLPEI